MLLVAHTTVRGPFCEVAGHISTWLRLDPSDHLYIDIYIYVRS